MFSLLLWGLARGRGQAFVLTVFISDANLATLGGTKLQRQLHQDYRRLLPWNEETAVAAATSAAAWTR